MTHADELPEAYKTLVDMHQKQWNGKGFPGLFYKKQVVKFLKEITQEFYKKGWLQIKTLYPVADDKSCVAVDLFYTYKNRIYSIVGGMDEGSPLSAIGAGNVIFTMTLKEAVQTGYKIFDYVAGLQEYKLRRGDVITTNKTVLIRPPDKKGGKRISFIKKYLRTQQKIRGETAQFKLFCKENGYSNGSREYFSLLFQRVASRRASTKQES